MSISNSQRIKPWDIVSYRVPDVLRETGLGLLHQEKRPLALVLSVGDAHKKAILCPILPLNGRFACREVRLSITHGLRPDLLQKVDIESWRLETCNIILENTNELLLAIKKKHQEIIYPTQRNYLDSIDHSRMSFYARGGWYVNDDEFSKSKEKRYRPIHVLCVSQPSFPEGYVLTIKSRLADYDKNYRYACPSSNNVQNHHSTDFLLLKSAQITFPKTPNQATNKGVIYRESREVMQAIHEKSWDALHRMAFGGGNVARPVPGEYEKLGVTFQSRCQQ